MIEYTAILDGTGAILAPFVFHGDDHRLRFTQADATMSIERLVELGPGVAQWSRVAQVVRHKSGELCVDNRMVGGKADAHLLEAAKRALAAALHSIEQVAQVAARPPA